MKLVDLNPRWVGAGGEGVTRDGRPVPERHEEFSNPVDGGPPYDDTRSLWQRTGETFEMLTLTPSILAPIDNGGCGWHGFVTNGEVRTV